MPTHTTNNPVKYIDPTGHWTCSGGTNCETWVQDHLDALKNGGDISRGAYEMFLSLDKVSEIEIILTQNIGSSGITSSTIRIGIDTWDKTPSARSAGVFAHEFTHIVQARTGDNISVLSELVAYEVQYQVENELGGNPSNRTTKAHNYWTGDPSTIDDVTLENVRDIISTTPNWLTNFVYRHLPLRPRTPDGVNPIPLFEILSAPSLPPTPAQNPGRTDPFGRTDEKFR